MKNNNYLTPTMDVITIEIENSILLHSIDAVDSNIEGFEGSAQLPW